MKKMIGQRPVSGDGPLAEVNMTPLIDVSLVLVVILMLASPLAFESSFGLQRTTKSAVEGAVNPVVLRLNSDVEMQVNKQTIAVSDLAGTLAPLLAVVPRPSVVVRCADGVRHGTFVKVLDVAKLTGAVEISMAGN